MKFLILSLLVLSCFAEEMAVTKAYTDYLKRHVSWEVVDYESNVFKGWTLEEVRSVLGDNLVELEGLELDDSPVPTKYMPETLDWTERGDCIHEIRNQASCGSCWAFSVASVVSDRCCLNGKDYGWLAPQELVSCDKSNSGCNGGDRTAAMNYVAANGLVHDACYPYKAEVTVCTKTCADGKDWASSHVCKCKNVRLCTGAANMISCLATGPVAVGMAVYRDFLTYKSGVYKWDRKSSLAGYHAIRLVGYGADYWKCANSWGASWGMQGYFNIGKGECNIENRNPVICDPTA